MSRPFVTCEDEMPDLFGIYNAFCAATSIPIMAVPIFPLIHSFQKRLPFPLLVLLFSLLLLFVGNLQQHTMIHNKLFIRVNIWYNFATAYCMVSCVSLPLMTTCKQTRSGATQFLSSSRDYLLLICLAVLGMVQKHILESAPDLQAELDIYEKIDGLLSLITVGVAGYASYQLNSPQNKFLRNFGFTFIALICTQTSTYVEEFIICDYDASMNIGWWLKHGFHAIVGHAVIAVLFVSAANLFVTLVEEVRWKVMEKVL